MAGAARVIYAACERRRMVRRTAPAESKLIARERAGEHAMPNIVETRSEQGAPAVVRAGALKSSIKVEQLTCTIGAELSNVNLGVASRDADLVAEIRALLLKHKVLFFRDQEITRAEHVAF